LSYSFPQVSHLAMVMNGWELRCRNREAAGRPEKLDGPSRPATSEDLRDLFVLRAFLRGLGIDRRFRQIR
jgi:hypothetical protein